MLKENNSPWILSFFLSFSLLTVSFLMPWLVVRNRFDSAQPQRDIFLPLRPEKSLEQTFIAKHDLVNIVILYFKNPGLANKGEYQFKIKGEEGKVLVERTFSGFNIGDPSDIRFQFEPLASSKGKKFILEVKGKSSTEPFVGIGADSEKGLSYSVYYRTVNKKAALVELLSSFTSRFFEDKNFFVFWTLTILMCLSLAIKG